MSFIYGVIAIPLSQSNLAGYCTSGWKNNKSGICSGNDGLWGPPHTCPNQLFTNSNCNTGCSVYTCSSVVPEDTTLPCSMSNSVYSVMLADKKIPLVNNLDPRQMGTPMAATTAIQNYAAPTIETTTGVINITPAPTCDVSNNKPGTVPASVGYMVLAYPLDWFVNWVDLDQFAPLQGTISPGNSAPFLNQGNGNPIPGSNGVFSVQLADGTTYVVPSLETQWGIILEQFCAGTTTACIPGINQGWGFCSNIFSNRSNNYCLNVYNSLPTTVEPLATWQTAVDAAGTQYCAAFTTSNGNPSGPPECWCITPAANDTFLELNNELTKAQINALNPYQPTPSGWSDMGNIGCWWFPCQNPNAALVPRDVKEGQTDCPTVCDNVVQIFGAKGSEINIDKLIIDQNIQCCNPNSSSYSGSCSNGGSNPSPPPSPRSKTFWQKYWGWIVFGGFILLLLLALVLWMIFKK